MDRSCAWDLRVPGHCGRCGVSSPREPDPWGAGGGLLLRAVPRGSLPQNMYRMAVQQFTMNSLGRHARIPRSCAAIGDAALRVVRVHYPAFTPTARWEARDSCR